MAELLEHTDRYDETPPPLRYPWDEWMDGRPRRLAPGVDFYPDPRTLRTYIYAQARKRGLKVVIAIEPTDHIVLQTYRPGDRRPLVPSPYRRLANGKLDRTAPMNTPEAPAGERPVCSICGKNLTPGGRPFGQCAKFNPTTGSFDMVHA